MICSATRPIWRPSHRWRERWLGWLADGRIKILFEKHWFYKQLPDETRTNAMKNGLAAFGSVSVGKFQIMGFNHKICGH